MKVLIVYATYSSGTETVANLVAQTLKKSGNQVEIVLAKEANTDRFKEYDLVIFGSPSWWVNGKQGQPHEHFFPLLDKLSDETFINTKCAVFGLGHSDYYINFCMAVDIIENRIREVKGKIIAQSLKIDQFYFDQQKLEKQVATWAKNLTTDDRLKNTLDTLKHLQNV